MAEADDTNHVSGDNKEKSSPDELSKADLEKQVKKYLNYLQKAKAKCNELNNKCTSLEKERDAANEVISKWRNESNTEYVEELRYEIKELKKKIHQLSGEKGIPNDDFEVIKAARDTALEALKKMKYELALAVTENQNNLSEIKRLEELQAEFRKQIHAKSVLEVDLREQLSVKDNLEADLKQQLSAKCALEVDLKEQLDAKVAAEVGLREKLNVTSAVEADLREQLSAKDTPEVDLKQRLSAMTVLEANLREQLIAASAVEADLREQLSATSAVKADLREQLSATSAVEADLREQLSTKNALEADLQQQLSAMGALEADLREQLSAKIALNAQDLDNANEKLINEYNDLSKKCKDIQSECEIIKSQFEENVNEKNKLFDENNILYEKLQKYEALLKEESFNLKQANSKLESENSEMARNIDLIQQDNVTLKSVYAELESKIKDQFDSSEILRKSLEEAKAENLKLGEDNKILNTEFTSLNLKYTDLLNKNCLVSDVQSMLLKLSCFANQAESQSLDIIEISEFICSQFEELKIKLDTLENEKLHENESKENTVSTIQELNTKIVELSLKLNSCQEENETLKLKLSELAEKKQLLESEYKENVSRKNLEFQTEIVDLSSKLESSEKENKNLKEKAEFNVKEQQKENKYKENISKRIQELETKISDLLSKLDSSEEENKSLEIKLQLIQKDLQQENEYKKSASIKIQELKCEITNISLKFSSFKEENENLKEKLEFTEKERQQENENNENTYIKIQELEIEITNLLSKLSSSEEENESLKEKLEFTKQERLQESEHKENVSRRIQEFEAIIEDVSLQLKSSEYENKSLKEKLEEFSEKENLKSDLEEDAIKRIQELEVEITNLSSKLSFSEEKNEDLKEKLQFTEKEILEQGEYKESMSRRIQEFETQIEDFFVKFTSSEEENKVLKEKLKEFTEIDKEGFDVCCQTHIPSQDASTEIKEVVQDVSLQTDFVDNHSEGATQLVSPVVREIAFEISEWGFASQGTHVNDSDDAKIPEISMSTQTCIDICHASTNTDEIYHSEGTTQLVSPVVREVAFEISEWGFAGLDTQVSESVETKIPEMSISTQTCIDICHASTNTDEICHSEGTTQLVSPVVKEVAFEISEWGFAGLDTQVSDSVETKIPEISMSTQACTDICHASTDTDEIVNEKLQALSCEMTDKNIEIENLLKECEILKSQLDLKSKLVEEIHCRLDFLLIKEEELNAEIETQNKVIRAANKQNDSLKIELYASKQLNTSLLHIRNALNEVKCMGNDIKLDVNAFNSDFMSILSNVNSDISSKCNNVYEHLEHNYVKKIADTQEEIKCYKAFLHDTSLEVKDILEMFVDVWLKGYLNNEIDHNINESFSISDSFDIDQFNIFKSNFLLHCNKIKNNLQTTIDVVSQLAEIRDDQAKELSDFKDSIVPSLQSKILDLENSLGNFNDANMEADQKSNNVVEALHKQLSETETKMNKFKAIALKWKKELAESQKKYQDSVLERDKYKEQANEIASELDNISSTHSQYVLNFQNLQNENDKLQDVREDMRADMRSLQTTLSSTQADLQKCNESLSLMESELEKSKQLLLVAEMQKTEMEGKRNDTECKIILLEAKNMEDQNKIQDLISELSKIQNDIVELMKEKDLLKQKLEDALKEGKQHSLLDLEMADYERSIEELTNKLEKRNAENDELQRDVENLEAKIDTLQAEIKICENHRDTEEKRAAGFKEILENTRKELISIKEHEAELQSNCAQLNLKVETLGQKGEDYKSQLSKQSAEIERLKEMLKSSAESHHKSVRCLESKIASQKQDILMAHKEVESVKQDFENYKIRVHSVLKQQQKNVPVLIPSQTNEKDNQDAQIEKLKLQIKDLSDKLYAVTLERDSLQEKHDHLLQRYNKIVEEAELKDRNWSNRIENVHMEKSKLQSLLQDMTSEHAIQSERIAATYKKQIKILQEKHNTALKELQSQLVSADIEIAHLQREQQKYINNSVTPSTQEESFSFDMFSQERQEGEGSECTEDGNLNIKHLSLATIPTGGFMPLEKLLQSPVESETSTSVASILDPEKLNNDLSASWKKIDHLRELLNESEANNLRLGDQVRILKEEIRRLERNKQREEHAENLEYLKNVFVKFATLEPGSERAMLVPVLTTMLRLSPAEQKQMKLVAGDKNSSETATATWGSYLHRWSGT